MPPFSFVLKHKVFAHLRETKLATNSICPSKKGSVPLIKTIIDQVLQLHPKIKYFHVGGDEQSMMVVVVLALFIAHKISP
ncbi:Hexosaminidase D [Exaiptasia diaphana]|nr:Hexosaminidase D [Exaiptasia diaphana]